MGITRSRGDIIIIFGAHSIYPPNCITNCVNHLISNEVDNVGGFINQVWPETSILGETIILALKSPFGVGGSTFRTKNSSSKPILIRFLVGAIENQFSAKLVSLMKILFFLLILNSIIVYGKMGVRYYLFLKLNQHIYIVKLELNLLNL